MLDRLTSMQVFMAVVRTGNFAAAAAERGISRAMATKHVQSLEAHLDVRLFNRSTRSTRLTEAGARYYKQLGEVLTELEVLEHRLSDDAHGVRGVLAVAAPPLFGALHLGPIVADFMTEYPDIQLRLLLTDRHIDLVDEGVDIAISVRELGNSSYIARRLTAVRMTVCASPAYLDARGTPLHPRDLAGHNCLLFAEQPGLLHSDWTFLEAGQPLYVRVAGDLVSNAGDALRAIAHRGRGIVRLPHYIVAGALADGSLRTILENYEPALRPVHALYPHREHLPGKIRRFLDFAAARLA